LAKQNNFLGRINPIDLGAAAVVLVAAVGVMWSPKLAGSVSKATGGLRSVLVTVDVKGIPAADPQGLLNSIRAEAKTSLVIRNQPHGSVDLKEAKAVAKRVVVVLPTGVVTTAPDPNASGFSTLDARFVLQGEGQVSKGGVVLGNQALKIGSPVELEGINYRINGVVSNVQVAKS
jgi:hypothetical protein